MRGDRGVPVERGGRRTRSRQYVRGPHIFRNRWGTWCAYLDGAVRKSLRTPDERIARERFAAMLDGRGSSGPAEATPQESTLSEIAVAYVRAPHGWTPRSLESTEARALAFAGWMERHAVRRPSQVSASTIDRWIDDRAETVSRATINRDLVVARRMLKWAAGRGMCDPTALEKREPLREPRRAERRIVVSHAELARVVRRCDRGVALVLRAAALTGMRLDELRNLRAEAIDHDAVRVRPDAGAMAEAWTGKSFRERRIPLVDEVVSVVRAFVVWRGGKGGKGRRIGLSGTWLAKRIDAACEKAGVPAFRMHDLRRLFATSNVDAGVPVRVVSGWLGHADVATTERYLSGQRSDDELRAVLPVVAPAHKARTKRGSR